MQKRLSRVGTTGSTAGRSSVCFVTVFGIMNSFIEIRRTTKYQAFVVVAPVSRGVAARGLPFGSYCRQFIFYNKAERDSDRNSGRTKPLPMNCHHP